MRKLILIALPVALAGCQTWGPTWSEVNGVRYFRTELNRTPTIIERVDGRSPSPARIGEPKAITTAATPMSWPPSATDTCSERTMSLSTPAVTITPQPMAKLPASKAQRGAVDAAGSLSAAPSVHRD